MSVQERKQRERAGRTAKMRQDLHERAPLELLLHQEVEHLHQAQARSGQTDHAQHVLRAAIACLGHEGFATGKRPGQRATGARHDERHALVTREVFRGLRRAGAGHVGTAGVNAEREVAQLARDERVVSDRPAPNR